VQLARHDDGVRLHLAGEMRAALDREVAGDLHVALEAAGDAYVAGALDLAFDREIGGDHGFLHVGALRAAGRIGGGEGGG